MESLTQFSMVKKELEWLPVVETRKRRFGRSLADGAGGLRGDSIGPREMADQAAVLPY